MVVVASFTLVAHLLATAKPLMPLIRYYINFMFFSLLLSSQRKPPSSFRFIK